MERGPVKARRVDASLVHVDALSIELGRPRTAGDVLNTPVLLLNRHFVPIRVASTRRAMVLLYRGSARALDAAGESYDFSTWLELPVRDRDPGLQMVGGRLRIPRVLHLMRYDRTPRFSVQLTRRNLMLRDQYQCQYCGRRARERELNVDHVLPRSRGGADSWHNLVVSCRECNLKKAHRTPQEAGMNLRRKPEVPHWSLITHLLLGAEQRFVEWTPFLGALREPPSSEG